METSMTMGLLPSTLSENPGVRTLQEQLEGLLALIGSGRQARVITVNAATSDGAFHDKQAT